MTRSRRFVLAFIFGGFGLIGLLVMILLIQSMINSRIENKVYVTGIITNIDSSYNSNHDDYDVYVKYEVDGEFVISKMNYYSSSMSQGDKIEIYYDKNNPNIISSNLSDNLFLLGIILCSLIPLIGIIVIIFIVKSKVKKHKLIKSGNQVSAEFVDVIVNKSYTVNGRHPFKIICKWINPNDNMEYEFKSENVWYDPYNFILDNDITEFKVYIDPNNHKKYYVDISNIPEK